MEANAGGWRRGWPLYFSVSYSTARRACGLQDGHGVFWSAPALWALLTKRRRAAAVQDANARPQAQSLKPRPVTILSFCQNRTATIRPLKVQASGSNFACCGWGHPRFVPDSGRRGLQRFFGARIVLNPQRLGSANTLRFGTTGASFT